MESILSTILTVLVFILLFMALIFAIICAGAACSALVHFVSGLLTRIARWAYRAFLQ